MSGCTVVGGATGGMLELAMAMSRGQVPSGEVLTELLSHAKEALDVQKHNTEWLNREGRMLASDLATLLWAAGQLAQKSNDPNLAKFLESSKSVIEETRMRFTELNKSLQQHGHGMQENVSKMYDDLKAVTLELAMAPEFRELLRELLNALYRLLEPAIEKGKEAAQQAVEKGKEVIEKGKEVIEKGKEKGKEIVEKGKEKGMEMAEEAVEAAKEAGAEAMEIAEAAVEEGSEGSPTKGGKGGRGRGGRGRGSAKGKAAAAATSVATAAKRKSEEIGQAVTDKAMQALENYVPLSADELTKVRDNLIGVLRKLAANVSYRDMMERILSMLSTLRQWSAETKERVGQPAKKIKSKVEQAASQVAESSAEAIAPAQEAAAEVKETLSDLMHSENFVRMMKAGKAFAEKFVGAGKFDKLFQDWSAFWDEVSGGPAEVFRILEEFSSFILDSLRQPTLLADTEHLKRATVVLEGGRKALFQLRAAATLGRVMWDLMDIISSITHEPMSTAIAESSRNIISHLLLDDKGQMSFKPDSLMQMRNLVVGTVVQELRTIPIGKIEGSTDNYDYRIEDLKFSGGDLLPEQVQIKAENDVSVNVKELSADTARANVNIKATGIKTQLENVKFWFRRRGMIMNIEDEGTAAVGLRGEGASITIQMSFDAKDPDRVFRLTDVTCDLDALTITVLESKHSWVMTALQGLYESRVKRLIEDEVVRVVRAKVNVLERQLATSLTSAKAVVKDAALHTMSSAASTASKIVSGTATTTLS